MKKEQIIFTTKVWEENITPSQFLEFDDKKGLLKAISQFRGSNVDLIYYNYVLVLQHPDGNIVRVYVGKGRDRRACVHSSDLKRGCHTNKLLQSIYNKSLVYGARWKLALVYNLSDKSLFTEREALFVEIDMIKNIGRRDLGTGPLANLTDGGEGVSGKVFSEEELERLSSGMARNWLDPKFRARMLVAQSNAVRNDPKYGAERAHAASQTAAEIWTRPGHRERRAEETRTLWQDEKYRALQRQRRKEKWADPEYQAKMKESQNRRRERERLARAQVDALTAL